MKDTQTNLRYDSFAQMLNAAKKESGDRVAFQYKNESGIRDITYAEFCHDVFSLCLALEELNIQNTHIACVGENRYEWINVYLSVLCSKGTFIPVNTELPEEEMTELIIHSDCRVLFYSRRYEQVILDNIDRLSGIEYFIGFDITEEKENFLSFEKIRSRGEELLLTEEEQGFEIHEPNDPAILIYTSGTTGIPKGVLLSEENLLSCLYSAAEIMSGFNKTLSVLPYHSSYQAICCILGTIYLKATLCTNDSMINIFKNLRIFQPDTLFLVPGYVQLLHKRIIDDLKKQHTSGLLKASIKISNFFRKTGLDTRKAFFEILHNRLGGNLKKIICGGAPLCPQTADFFDSIGIPVINGYGITECSGLISVNKIKENDHRTVGVPLSCIEIKLQDEDLDGNGEIAVKGPTVMLGYYKNTELTEKVLDSEGWFYTGDYGKITEDNKLIITGRKNYMIVLPNGQNIYPEEIEKYIRSVPYIEEAVVYAKKNRNGREIALCAEVYLGEEITNSNKFTDYSNRVAKDINEACKKLPPYKHIAQIAIRAQDFPKTSSNKIKRQSVGF